MADINKDTGAQFDKAAEPKNPLANIDRSSPDKMPPHPGNSERIPALPAAGVFGPAPKR